MCSSPHATMHGIQTKGPKGEVVFLFYGNGCRLRLNGFCTVFRHFEGTSALNLNTLPLVLNGHLIVSSSKEKDNSKMPRTAVAVQGVGCVPVSTVAPNQSSLCGTVSPPAHWGIALV